MPLRSYNRIRPSVADDAFIDDTALIIGDVQIGSESSVWPMAVVRGDVQRIRVGCGSNIQDSCVLHVTHDGVYSPGGIPLEIGDYVTVGHRAVLHACRVGDLCLIGVGSIIMDGAVLEGKLMVGAGSLVPPGHRLESGQLYLGSPARRARALTEKELDFLDYSARHYIKLKEQHAASGSNS